MTGLSCAVHIETLTSESSSYDLTATPEEKVNVAERLNLLSIEKLEAHLLLQKKDQLFLTGIITADVIQQCVRTLVPLPQHLEIEVDEIFFLPSSQDQEVIDLEEEERGELLEGNTLEIGEIVIQLLSLNLDPYPVAPESKPIDYKENDGPSSPFEVLKKKK